jgi:lysozyme family protein
MGEIANSFYSSLNTLNAMDEQHTQNQLAKQAGTALAGGDYAGAANAYYKGGDVANGMKVQDAGAQLQDQQRKREAEGALAIAKGVRGIVASGKAGDPNDPATYQRAYQAAVQYAPSLGIDPKHLQQMAPAFQADPQGFLNFMESQAQKELQFFQTDRGIYVGDRGTGKVSEAAPLPGKPLVLGKDQRAFMANDPNAPPQAAQQPTTAPAGAFDAGSFIKSFVLPHEGGLNPSDINGSPSNFGINQKANPGVNVAKLTPDQAAQIYQNKYLPMSGAANLPPALAGPVLDTAIINPSKAKQFLAQSGGDPNKFMDLREAWLNNLASTSPAAAKYARAWSKRNADLRSYIAQQGAAQPAAQDPNAPEGYHLVASGVSSASKAEAAAAVDPNIVKGLLEGRIAPPTQKAAATPYWQAQLEAAASQDPTFDMVNYQARAKTRSDFTSGKSAQNITALNTVVGHLDTLDRAIDGLNNTDNLGPVNRLNNQLAHGLARASGTDQRVQKFETAKQAVATELTRVFRGTGGAEADIQGWQQKLDAAASPQSLHTVVQQMTELVNSRLEAIGEQYHQGMGLTKQPITLLTPDKQRAFQRLMGGQAQAAPTPAPANASGWSVRRVR